MMANQHTPANEEAERAFLSCMLQAPHFLPNASSVVDGQIFYPWAKTLWNAIRDVSEGGQQVNGASLSAYLSKHKQLDAVGGRSAIAELIDFEPSPMSWRQYAVEIAEKGVRRRMLDLANKAAIAAHGTEPVEGIVEDLQTSALALATSAGRHQSKDLLDCMQAAFDFAKEVIESKTGLLGITTGFPIIDDATSGLRAGLTVIAARPGMGKSALALQMAHSMTKAGHKIGFFSLEMPDSQVGERAFMSFGQGLSIQQIAHDARRYNAPFSSEDQLKMGRAMKKARRGYFHVNDSSSITVQAIRSQARKWIKEDGVECIFIDQLSFIERTSGDPEHLAIGKITRALAQMADSMRIPIVLICQLNREVNDKPPTLSNLKGSGSIEEDAFLVLAPYRKEGEDEKAEIHCLKSRGAKNFGSFPVLWNGACQEFQWSEEIEKRLKQENKQAEEETPW